MAEEHDNWMSGLGVEIGALRQAASDAASSVVEAATDTAASVVKATSDIDATPALAAMPAPAPAPGILEEVEEAVASGVRVIARAAPEIEEVGLVAAAVAAAPVIAVGVLAGAAVLTWSSDAGAVWEGKRNPETGKYFESQEEWDRYQASLRDHRKQAPPLAPPVPGMDYDDPDRAPDTPSCDSMFPGVPKCTGNARGFENLADAETAEPNRGDIDRVVTDTMDAYRSHPDGQNNHRTYYDKNGNKLFTLVKTPCCSESPAGPVLTWRWSSAN